MQKRSETCSAVTPPPLQQQRTPHLLIFDKIAAHDALDPKLLDGVRRRAYSGPMASLNEVIFWGRTEL